MLRRCNVATGKSVVFTPANPYAALTEGHATRLRYIGTTRLVVTLQHTRARMYVSCPADTRTLPPPAPVKYNPSPS